MWWTTYHIEEDGVGVESLDVLWLRLGGHDVECEWLRENP